MRTLSMFVSLAFLLAAVPGEAQHRGATERITLVVEVVAREDRPTIPCGIMGAQPRDVTARVVSVEEGTFEGTQILLSWPVCALESIVIGQRYRIHIRRWASTPVTPEMRFRVRRAEAMP